MTGIVPEWRHPQQRYGIFRIRDGRLEEVAAVENPEAIGLAVFLLGGEGEWEGAQGFGVWDYFAGDDPGLSGSWLYMTGEESADGEPKAGGHPAAT